ncbi:tripartite tricarboxylate transporter substrate binding protein [Paeniglutamicibacter sp. MACA_103]|uniref:tripartite tricarboxylate transporter substrate binding protein n=1 Tax=Paeniglutamicibacter sp. MACA_103 TaxID=3377337 RepID=UPI0038956C3F
MKRILATTSLAALLLAAVTGCGTGAAGTTSSGEDFPRKGKSVELIVAFASGGAVDTAARLIQPVLERELGTNVEVVNKPGAGGQIGYTAITNATPDGYTIGATGSPSVVVSPLDPSRGASYTRTDFQPLGRHVIDPAVVAVQPDSPYNTLEELLNAAKEKPDTITATTTGQQGGEHFAVAQIKETAGASFSPVHFSEGASQATTAFLGRHVEVLAANVSDVTDLVKQGKAKVLGVMDTERSAALPEVPTFTESGYDIVSATARGYSAPAGLPEAVATKLEAALETAINDPEVVAKMENLGLTTSYQSASEYEEFWAGQEADYKAVLSLVQAK